MNNTTKDGDKYGDGGDGGICDSGTFTGIGPHIPSMISGAGAP